MLISNIEFFYDFGSPKSFFVHKLLPNIAKKYNVEVIPKPILLGGVFKLTNNKSPMETFKDVKGKKEYENQETTRFVKRHNLAFQWNPYFPVNTIGVMRGAIYTNKKDFGDLYTETIFQAMWVDQKKMDDPTVISETLTAAGLPTEEIMEATQTPIVKAELIDATNHAVARNIFGAPTMFVGNEMFFGKEGLDEIDFLLSNQ